MKFSISIYQTAVNAGQIYCQLLLEHYEALEPEYQAKVPLQRIWLPTE